MYANALAAEQKTAARTGAYLENVATGPPSKMTKKINEKR